MRGAAANPSFSPVRGEGALSRLAHRRSDIARLRADQPSGGGLLARVGDPAMGGAYLTLLNTVANVGLTLPKAAAFWAADAVGLGPASAAALLGGLALGAWYAVAMPALERAPLKAWRA